MANEYSQEWFRIFLKDKKDGLKEEIEGLIKYLPLNHYKNILDLCCGFGRHSEALGSHGYQVLGVDRDSNAIDYAKKNSNGRTKYIEHDMQDIGKLEYTFDAIISMWHSFGYFSDKVNSNIIKNISKLLHKNGRFILDIYNREFFENHLGERSFSKGSVIITERVDKVDDRFNIRLSYNNVEMDEFNWQLYSYEEICTLCERYNLKNVAKCVWWKEDIPIDKNIPRMQLVFEKI